MSKNTRILLFPEHAQEYFVNPDIGGTEEEVIFTTSSLSFEIEIEEEFSEFRKKNCLSGCPYYFNFEEQAKQLIDNKTCSSLKEVKDYLADRKPEDSCSGSLYEAMSNCMYTDNYQDTRKVSLDNLPPALMSYKPNASKADCTSLYIKKETEQDLLVKPYQIGNIKSDATICWGKNKKPSTPVAAWNTFWKSPFNKRHVENLEHMSYVDFVKNFNEEMVERNWVSYPLNDFIHRTKHCDGVLYSNDPKLVDLIPEKFRVQKDLIVGFFSKANASVWVLDFNGYIAVRDGKMSSSVSKLMPLGTVEELFR